MRGLYSDLRQPGQKRRRRPRTSPRSRSGPREVPGQIRRHPGSWRRSPAAMATSGSPRSSASSSRQGCSCPATCATLRAFVPEPPPLTASGGDELPPASVPARQPGHVHPQARPGGGRAAGPAPVQGGPARRQGGSPADRRGRGAGRRQDPQALQVAMKAIANVLADGDFYARRTRARTPGTRPPTWRCRRSPGRCSCKPRVWPRRRARACN